MGICRTRQNAELDDTADEWGKDISSKRKTKCKMIRALCFLCTREGLRHNYPREAENNCCLKTKVASDKKDYALSS